VEGFVEVIARISELSNSIAASVEEQTAATGEISSNAQNAREHVNQITEMGQHIADASTQNAEGALTVQEAAGRLEGVFQKLQGLLKEFKV
jgi:methyl-accepting chemotaxis protein